MSTLNVTQIKNPDAASPALTLNTDGSVDIAISALSGGPLAGFRNAVINGNFDIWQRSTSNSTHLGYSADRWGNNFVGSSATSAQQLFTLGQTDVPGEPTFFMRTTVSSVTGADNRVNLFQRIESVRTFAGQEVTLSFWAKADAAKNIAVELLQNFGNGGSPSALVRGIGVTKVAVGTSWQLVKITTTIPSIAGKTLGTDDDGFLLVTIWFDAGTNYDAYTDSLGHQSGVFDVSRVQLEPGPVATVFERRPLGVELALCQRYYWTSGQGEGRPIAAGQAVATNQAGYVVVLPVPMRTTSVTVSHNQMACTLAGGNLSVFTALAQTSVVDPHKIYLRFSGASGLVSGNASLLVAGTSGNPGRLNIDAEL